MQNVHDLINKMLKVIPIHVALYEEFTILKADFDNFDDQQVLDWADETMRRFFGNTCPQWGWQKQACVIWNS